jgi:peptidoglycan L-alanyl-D-glutamate endopeptidase CwlK
MTKDPITLKRIDLLHPDERSRAHAMYDEICLALSGRAICRFTHTLRTDKEQEALFAQGRTTPGKIVTWARGGESYHNYGLAFDIALIIDGKTASWDTIKDFDGDRVADWMEVVAIAKKYGWEWGGDWPRKKRDMPHFQKRRGKTTAQLRALRGSNLYPVLKAA